MPKKTRIGETQKAEYLAALKSGDTFTIHPDHGWIVRNLARENGMAASCQMDRFTGEVRCIGKVK